MPEEMKCDLSAKDVSIGRRFHPNLKEPSAWDFTDGLCAAVWCGPSDLNAWHSVLRSKINALSLNIVALKTSAKKAQEGLLTDRQKAILKNAKNTIDVYESEWEDGPSTWAAIVGATNTLMWWMTSYSNPLNLKVHDLVRRMADLAYEAACVNDVIEQELESIGAEGGAITPKTPEEKKAEEEAKKGDSGRYIGAVALFSVAGLLIYSATKGRKKPAPLGPGF